MVEKNTGELPGGIEIGPINSRSTILGVEDELREGRVKRGEKSEIGRVISVSVPRVNAWSLPTLPLLARHLAPIFPLIVRRKPVSFICKLQPSCFFFFFFLN